jgi:PAS domain S-box-containing protein
MPNNTSHRNARHAPPRRSAGRLLVVFAPILALGVFSVLLALGAGLFGFYPNEMYTVAVAVGAFVMLLAILLFYQQTAGRRASESALQDARAQVGDIVSSAMDPIISVDSSQRIILFNDAAEKVFRWPRAAVLGQPLEMLIPERLRGAHRGHIERFGATAATARRMGPLAVLTGLRANGEEFPIEASISSHMESGSMVFTVILRDVSARVEADRQIAGNAERLRSILDSAMDAIITVDESQRVVLFNAAAEAVFGCAREQAIGAPLAWFIPERFRAGHDQHIQRFGESNTRSRRMGVERIVTGLRNNGEEFPLDAAISQTEEGGKRFYTVILRDVTERVRSDRELRQSRDELRELSAAAHLVREQERGRVARELHDELGQALTTLKMEVSWLSSNVDFSHAEIRDRLFSMDHLLDATVAATRRISSEMRPLMLDDLGLVPASEWLVQKFGERTGIECTIAISGEELELKEPYASALFRILQESLTNVARHARARHVEVRLDVSSETIDMSIRDDGSGFIPAEAMRKSFGLRGQRERASMLGGEVRIDSKPGQGTAVHVNIPFKPEEQQA